MLALGLDIGGTAVKAALVEGDRPLRSARSQPYSRPDRHTLLDAARQAAQDALESRVPDAVGLCVPGILDEPSQRITFSANVPGLVGLELGALVSAALGRTMPLPPSLFSDAYAAAHDLWVTESPQPLGRLLAISLGTGVGASVLDDGTPLLVSGRSPGHLGQIDVTIHEPGREPPLGPDGSRGGLEAYIGLPALLHRFECSSEHVPLHLAPDAVPIRALVRALRIAHALYRPSHVRLLGGVGLMLAPRAADIKTLADKDLTSVARPGWTLGFGTSQHHAARGVARLALRALARGCDQ